MIWPYWGFNQSKPGNIRVIIRVFSPWCAKRHNSSGVWRRPFYSLTIGRVNKVAPSQRAYSALVTQWQLSWLKTRVVTNSWLSSTCSWHTYASTTPTHNSNDVNQSITTYQINQMMGYNDSLGYLMESNSIREVRSWKLETRVGVSYKIGIIFFWHNQLFSQSNALKSLLPSSFPSSLNFFTFYSFPI